MESLEGRRVMAFDFVTAFSRPDAFIEQASVQRESPQEITLKFSPGAIIDPTTLGGITVVRSGGAGDAFDALGSQKDVTVGIGSISVDDLPNQNQVTIRFNDTLPDDSYEIRIDGTILKTTAKETLARSSVKVGFRLDLGAQVMAVVPQPIVRSGGGLTQNANQIVVYFNANDPLLKSSAETVSNYGLFTINQTTGRDASGPVNPTSVSYDAAAGRAVLSFASIPAGNYYRLQVGGVSAPVAPAPAVAETPANDLTNSTFTGAIALGTLTAGGQSVTGAIVSLPQVPTPAGNLDIPLQAGQLDEPGHRDTPTDSGSHGIVAPQDNIGTAITVQRYNFKAVYGYDPQGRPLYNQITETQKQRAREIFDLYSRSTGIRFVETASSGITVATGDMRAIDPGISTAPTGLAEDPGVVLGLGEVGGRAILDFTENWGNSEYGGAWFRTAMHEIGHALGLQHSYDIASIMGNNLSPTGTAPIEPSFPGNYDIEHLAQIQPADGSDIDVYSFTLASRGRFSAETVIARPGTIVTSTLDSVLTLYRKVGSSGVMVARNDDSFGRDSFIGMDLDAGDYYVTVTSTGNTNFNPDVENSGGGGRSEGAYKLNLGFVPETSNSQTIVDTTGTQLDGDRDGVAGGAYSFWFQTASAANTLIVDKAAYPDRAAAVAAGADGSLAKPYVTIQDAIANIGSRTVIRIVGNKAGEQGTSLPYLIGRSLQGAALEDGLTFNVPAGVTVLIDEGAVFKLRDAIIDVGSSSQLVSRAHAALQVLGTPASKVVFTSYHDDTVGSPVTSTRRPGGDDGAGPAVASGQWGGIVLRADSDFGSTADTRRVFLNTISNADIRYGGGEVSVDSQPQLFTPIHLETTRPTLVFNTITKSAGAPISADPDSFEESNGRAGPEVHGNTVTGNSINGLFIRVRTDAGSVIDKLDLPARLQSKDITYFMSENLVISGGAGGYLDLPVATVSADPVSGSAAIALPTVAGLTVGMRVTGTGIPDGASIISISGNTVTLDAAASQSGVGIPLTFFAQTARPTGRLTIDPGVVIKLRGSRIELERGGSQLIAEGLPGRRVIFTSLDDNRFGAGGTFDTNGNQPDKFNGNGVAIGTLTRGDWAGIDLNAGAKASIDYAYLAFAGGTSGIEGGFDRFNAIEVQQGDLRLTNSRIEHNDNGLASTNRNGRQGNDAATVFVRGAQPVIVGNDFRDNLGAVISINANALDDSLRNDTGRVTGPISRFAEYDGNRGALVRDNTISYDAKTLAGGAVAGMRVRGEEITVEGVWDDVDIVHVLRDEVVVNNFHTKTGLRLVSQSKASLVVKLQGSNAGFTASGAPLDIADRIGGTVQVIGQPGYPVILTSLKDDTVGASRDALGLLVRDTNVDGSTSTPTAADWRSLQFLPLSNDRNVSILQESEPDVSGKIDANATVGSAESLGTLAPNFATGTNTWDSAQEKSGDDNRRLGFEVHGAIAADNTHDVDMYAFTGYAGSEIWIDVDNTSPSLDAMLELLDASGQVLARSADSQNDTASVTAGTVAETSTVGVTRTYQLQPNVLGGTLSGTLYTGEAAVQTFSVNALGQFTFTSVGLPSVRATAGSINFDTGLVTLTYNAAPAVTQMRDVSYDYGRLTRATLGLSLPLSKDATLGGDTYSQNPRDPGMRVILPGTPGQTAQYYVRVRSQPSYTTGTGGTTQTAYESALQSPATNTGATSGEYELRIRERQRDEKPGSTVRYADIRYPATGIDVIGLPRNSPLVGETGESAGANDSRATAQQLGNLLTIDRNTISVAGTTVDSGDVDWYSFTIDYDRIQSIGGVNDGTKTWSTVFDIDYATADLTLSVFDSSGRLLYVGRDSNIADDQPGVGQGADFDDLSRGSQTTTHAFIGPVQLPAGTPGSTTRYYVAVSSNEQMPTVLNGSFQAAASNPLLRLEPINSVKRVVEDHIGTFDQGYSSGSNPAVTRPTTGPIIDTSSATALAANVRPFTLADVTLFVATGSSLYTADAFRGGIETTVANNAYTFGSVGDIDMRTDGRLFQYFGANNDAGNNGLLREISPGNGGILSTAGDGVSDDPAGGPTPWQVTGQQVDALAIGRTDVATYEDSVYYSIRDGGSSYLYRARTNGNAAFVTTEPQFSRLGQISGVNGTNSVPVTGYVSGLQFRNDSFGGGLYGISSGGQFFNIVGGSPGHVTDFSTDPSLSLHFGETFEGLAAAPVNLEGGRYVGQFFAITNWGRLVCIDPSPGNPANRSLVANVFDTDNDGIGDSVISNSTVFGAKGLAFSPLDVNLWHPTYRRGDLADDTVGAPDTGHGINTALDNTRIYADRAAGAMSMYFGLEQYSTKSPYAIYGGQQYGATYNGAYNWQEDLTAGGIGDNYDLPGGAYGSLITNSFSLAGYASADKPTLYFNYFLDTENAGSTADKMRDSARAFVSTDDGLTWQLVATNNSPRSILGSDGAELPNTLSVSSGISTHPNQVVQELFDSTGTWRQARIDLGQFAGASSIRLRFDFSTAGKFDGTDRSTATPDAVLAASAASTGTTVSVGSTAGIQVGMLLQVTAGQPTDGDSPRTVTAIDTTNGTVTLDLQTTIAAGETLKFFRANQPLKNNILGLANQTGDLSSATRGQNNAFEGFYVDDIIVGFAERGEMVTYPTTTVPTNADTSFFSLNTPVAGGYPQQVLQGPYQLEMRRGTEYGTQTGNYVNVDIQKTFDTNDRMVTQAAAATLELARNTLTTLTGTVAKLGNGAVVPGASLSLAANVGATVPQYNLVTWSVDLAAQPTAYLQFDYQTGTSDTSQNLPATFTTDASNDLPTGDGVAISNDGGITWTTIADLGSTGQDFSLVGGFYTFGPVWKTVRLDLASAAGLGGLTSNTVIGFFQSGKLAAASGGGYQIRNGVVTTAPITTTSGLVGDANQPREQGQFIVANNVVSNARDYGIRIDAGTRDAVSNAPYPGVPRNLGSTNPTGQIPGAVVVNNIINGSGRAGVLVSGDPNTGNVPVAAAPFARLVNNTITGTVSTGPSTVSPSGKGVVVNDNAVPTLLNNLFANLATGVEVGSTGSLAGTIVAYNGYYNVASQVAGVLAQTNSLTLSTDPFVNAAAGNFYLNAKSQAIDTALNSLQDRSAIVTYNATIGVPPSPILAPQLDIYGQVRADDPAVAPAISGLGYNVFGDLGAVDRVDFRQPTIAIAEPLDNGTSDKNLASNAIRLERQDARSIRRFSLQLNDVGVGIDPTTIVSAAFVLQRGGVTLVDGTDYLFRYYETTNTVAFESVSEFAQGSYTITVTTRAAGTVDGKPVAGLVTDLANNTLLPNNGSKTTFSIELADIPAAPTGLAAATGDGAVTLSWAAASDGGSAITDYVVEQSLNGSVWTLFNDGVSTATTATVTGLTIGTPYFFRVAARNAVNASATAPGQAGVDFNYVTTSASIVPFALPSAPRNLTGVAGNTSVALTWSQPASLGGAPITDYRVEYRTAGGTWAEFSHAPLTGDPSGVTVTGLVNSQAYEFRVAGITRFGTSAQYAFVSATTTSPALPTAPRNLTGVAGDASVALTWSEPASLGDGAITDYRVEYRTGDGGWIAFPHAPLTGNPSAITVTGLVNGQAYEFRVAGITPFGTSAEYAAVTATPTAPPVAPNAPTGVLVVAGDSSVTLNWTAPAVDGGRPVTDYVVQYRLATSPEYVTLQHAASTATSATVAGLTNNSAYVFRVAAKNSIGTGAYSDDSAAVTPRKAANAPQAVRGVAGNGSVTLTWSPPVAIRGVVISGYVVQVSTNGGLTWRDGPSTVAARATVTGLQNGIGHVFRVMAVSGGARGRASIATAVLTPFSRTAHATAPTALVGVGAGGTISLSWTAPAANEGGDVKDYLVQIRLAGSTRWTTIQDTVARNPFLTVRRLRAGQAYVFRVAAKNLTGQFGAFSQESATVIA